MSLPNGTRIGSYEITGQLGAGGMGEVYRATDSRLKRVVALKVLPPLFATDPDRMARFEREARVLASLNHPHIATIYGVEERALVMELVDGPSLQERIQAGPIPLSEALPIVSQMADALQYAHDRGVVHRDLKPANVKFTSDGAVKILDFGLAKALDENPLVSDPDNSPTMSLLATRAGVILGTASYMAPEQARGRSVDHRADIWAFGVVLYEMLTGKRLFQGEDITETLASVVKEQPSLNALPERAKPLVSRCIEKDPRKRLHAVGDWMLMVPAEASPQPNLNRGWKAALPWAVAIVLAVALASTGLRAVRTPVVTTRSTLLSVSLPSNLPNLTPFLDISPDGRRLVLGFGAGNRNLLMLRALDSNELLSIVGAEGRAPFWSFDSRFIGFFSSEGKLLMVPASGGPTRELCAGVGTGGGGTWNRDNIILFGTEYGQIRRVPATGGECPIVGLDEPGVFKRFPVFLPDGHHYFYTVTGAGVYLTDLQNTPPRKILADLSSVVYVTAPEGTTQGYLLFGRNSALMAQVFDETVLEVVGDPFVVVNDAAADRTGKVAAAVAADGMLVYIADNPQQSQLTWVDRSGMVVGTLGSPGLYSGVGISPKGSYAVARVSVANSASGLQLFDLVRGPETRLTPSSASNVREAVWSEDESTVLVTMTGPDGPGLYRRDVASGKIELVEKATDAARWDQRILSDWSSDGKQLFYTEVGEQTQADIWSVPMESGRPAGNPVKVVATDQTDSQGQLSPDGKWLAFVSGDAFAAQIKIQSLSDSSKTYTLSGTGFLEPRFALDGSLYFFQQFGPPRQRGEGSGPQRGGPRGGAPANQRGGGAREGRPLLSVSLQPEVQGGLRIGAMESFPGILRFGLVTAPRSNIFKYSPHPDGRFLVVAEGQDEVRPAIHVISNGRRFIAERMAARQDNP